MLKMQNLKIYKECSNQIHFLYSQLEPLSWILFSFWILWTGLYKRERRLNILLLSPCVSWVWENHWMVRSLNPLALSLSTLVAKKKSCLLQRAPQTHLYPKQPLRSPHQTPHSPSLSAPRTSDLTALSFRAPPPPSHSPSKYWGPSMSQALC